MVNHKKDEAATLQAMLQERDREVEGMRKVCVCVCVCVRARRRSMYKHC